jgi:hypothetical protein
MWTAATIAWLAMGMDRMLMAAAADDGIQTTPAMGWSTW